VPEHSVAVGHGGGILAAEVVVVRFALSGG